MAPPSAVRNTVPPPPLTHATRGETTLTPRSRTVTPLPRGCQATGSRASPVVSVTTSAASTAGAVFMAWTLPCPPPSEASARQAEWVYSVRMPTFPAATRRAFLATTTVLAAHVWVPRAVKGYHAGEVAGQLAGSQGAVGISKWDLDTPALCVDLDRLEANIATMQAAVRRFGLATRPHAKTHRSADIAKLQLAAGAIGVCCAKLGEAEALMPHGIDRICMTTANLVAGQDSPGHGLRKRSAGFIQAVDDEKNARDLSAAAREAGVVADVVVDVAVGTRSGIPAGDAALQLAKLVDTLPGLKLRGCCRTTVVLSTSAASRRAGSARSPTSRATRRRVPP